MAKEPQLKFFTTLGGTKLDRADIPTVSDFTTDSIKLFRYDEKWNVWASRELTDGDPRWTLEYSYDNTNFHLFDAGTFKMKIPEVVTKRDFRGIYLRIKFLEDTATGFVNFALTQTNSE